jgi:uncharacterized NAD(P)/FAD-binding protein YdhS
MSLKTDSPRVAVIGGGASGVLTAVQLLDALPNGHIYLIERSGQVGRGIAYGACNEGHLLNVRAANMSYAQDDPSHFVRWLTARGLADSSVGSQFVPRKLYGRYLFDVLKRAESASTSQLTVITDEAVSLTETESLRLGFQNQEDLEVDHIVFAMGNLPTRLPRPLTASPRVVEDPWAKDALLPIPPSADVLIVGTSLTMVDTVLSLGAQGHTGKIFARSRHGLLSKAHAPVDPVRIDIDDANDLISCVIGAIRDSGECWRGVVDGLRPRTVEIWQRLSWKQRGQFRKRLQVFWDVHRHRIPESVAAKLMSMSATGQLDIGKGRLCSVSAQQERLKVQLIGPEGKDEILVDWIINCTGPSPDLRSAKLPLLETAVEAGVAEYDPLGLGLMVKDCGQSAFSESVWALGPMCRGCRLETTAIPEIRNQAKCIAERIASIESDR